MKVWKSSRAVGCGVAGVPVAIEVLTGRYRQGGCVTIVCRYNPAGNIANNDAFKANGT
jgi:hypothetical protein